MALRLRLTADGFDTPEAVADALEAAARHIRDGNHASAEQDSHGQVVDYDLRAVPPQ